MDYINGLERALKVVDDFIKNDPDCYAFREVKTQLEYELEKEYEKFEKEMLNEI